MDATPWWVTLILAVLGLIGGGGAVKGFDLLLAYYRGTREDARDDRKEDRQDRDQIMTFLQSREARIDKVEATVDRLREELRVSIGDQIKLQSQIAERDKVIAELRKGNP